MQSQLRVDPRAEALAQEILASDLPREMIEETLATRDPAPMLEAGRTVCGTVDDARRPLDRGEAMVDLQACPQGELMGILHTHPVTEQGLVNPVHSLPDYANVVYGVADTSIVVGAETSHVVVAPRHEDREHMRQLFHDVLGTAFSGPEDVAEKIESGAVEPSPQHRRDLDRQFGELAYRVDTAMPDLAAEIQGLDEASADLVPAQAVCSGSAGDRCGAGAYAPNNPCASARSSARSVGNAVRSALDGVDVDIMEIVIGTAVGQLVSKALERAVFRSST